MSSKHKSERASCQAKRAIIWASVQLTTLPSQFVFPAALASITNENINTSAIIIFSVHILVPIIWSRAQQLNHQLNSFLCSSAYNIKSQLLTNDLIVLRKQGKDHGGQTEYQEGAGEPMRHAWEGDESIQFRITEFESNSEFRTTSYLNWRTDCIRPLFLDVLHMHGKLSR
jgi:hypothetical protein